MVNFEVDDYVLSRPFEWLGGTINKAYRFKGAVQLAQEQPDAIIDSVDKFNMSVFGVSLHYGFSIFGVHNFFSFPFSIPSLCDFVSTPSPAHSFQSKLLLTSISPLALFMSENGWSTSIATKAGPVPSAAPRAPAGGGDGSDDSFQIQ